VRRLPIAVAILTVLLATTAVHAAGPDKMVSDDGPDRIVVVRDVTTTPRGGVSGVLVNHSHKQLRDIRLLIHHTWLWKKEMKPGDDSPGRVDYYTVRSELPPEGEIELKYRPEPPLPDRDDGHFDTTVEVAGWTEIGH
jgi:hypothetical protein